jgi:hypothetical protein
MNYLAWYFFMLPNAIFMLRIVRKFSFNYLEDVRCFPFSECGGIYHRNMVIKMRWKLLGASKKILIKTSQKRANELRS